MALSAFGDRSKQLQRRDLEATLGRSFRLWDRLREHLVEEHGALDESWNFAGDKYGWSLRQKTKKRTIVSMIPGQKCFLAGIVLGEKAVRVALESSISAETLAMIEEAPRYAEGRGFRIEVRTKRNLEDVTTLLAIKMST